MDRLLILVSLFILSASTVVLATSSCVAFDVTWNLLAFGFGGKDYNAGTQDNWGSGSATDITASGRPPFNGANTTCYLSQFTNAIYVLGADSSNPASIYIYDATAKSWSTQSVTTGGFDPSSFNAILDHDTNVFYALSKGELYSLDMALEKSANSSTLSWVDVQKAGFTTDNYQPVMALAQNHIYFLDVPGVAAGSAQIFVIHFSFFQPEAQSYGNFPATHGQATSFFQDVGVQEEFAFIPDDGSATYIINVETNTTQTLAGPTTKDPLATYFASTTSLVQLSSGAVSYLPYNPNTTSANSAASWSIVKNLASVVPVLSSGAASPTGTASAKPTNTTGGTTGGGSGKNEAASSRLVGLGMSVAVVLGVVSLLLS
jgi:hypothetical protein